MTDNINATIDIAIRTSATAKGYTAVSVRPQTIADRPGVMDAGEWFLLSTKRNAEADWEFLGRRKTKDELLGLLENTATRNALRAT